MPGKSRQLLISLQGLRSALEGISPDTWLWQLGLIADNHSGFATELETTESPALTNPNTEASSSRGDRETYPQQQTQYWKNAHSTQYFRDPSRESRDHWRSTQDSGTLNNSQLSSLESPVTPTQRPSPRLYQQASPALPSEAYPYLCSPPFGAANNRQVYDCVNFIPGDYCPLDPFQPAESSDPNDTRTGHLAGSFIRRTARHSSPQPVASYCIPERSTARHSASRSEGSNAASKARRHDKWSSLIEPVHKFASQTKRRFSSSNPSSLRNRLLKRSRSKSLQGSLKPVPEEPGPRPTMNSSRHLDPAAAMAVITKQKSEAMRLAREQSAAVTEMCRRANNDPPQYSFEELIGKGAYGRVYKGYVV